MAYPGSPELVQVAARKCSSCGAELPPSAGTGEVTCPYCGTKYIPAGLYPPAPPPIIATTYPTYIPPNAVYSRPAQRPRWPALFVLVFFSLFFFLPLIIAFQATSSTSGNGIINVTISANPTQGPSPLSVSFTAVTSGSSGSVSYQWQFGDGTESAFQSPYHTYTTAGTYVVTLNVWDTNGDSGTSPALTVDVLYG